jgi:two-component system chemotaxis sensor kinase CheA
MSLQDDGQGIDLEKIKERAVEKQILKPKQAQDLSDQETMSYIFHPDISSSPIITEISGRGIGMSVVQTSLEQLGGRIKVDSQRNQGTTFTLKLPVTLTTLRGLLVQIHTQHYIIPCANVLRILRIQAKDIKSIDNKEAIQVNDQILSLIDPAIVLGIAREGNAISQTWFKAVTVVASGQCLALYIDEIIDEQEILVKGLGKQLQKVPNISGATILASGQVVPVLDIPDLIKASVIQYQTQDTLFSVSQRKRDRQKSVLVVEDTLTSRMLIKNVLEASGYHILTANDGQEAWVSLQSQYCDCVVSDVEMPRMDGFELTTRIRNDNDLVNLPVILITARDSKEDREKGIEAGANAYIVKSNFDQNNLLEALDRLI